MTGNPTIRISGAGSRRAATELGQTIAQGVASAVEGSSAPLHIDTLRLKLPANAGAGVLERAIRAALEKERGR